MAEQIAPLAGKAIEPKEDVSIASENWREVLRLCVACCSDDDVDDALTAILTPLPDENHKNTARSRSILAALCLADEPNASDDTAQKVVQIFTQHINDGDGDDFIPTALYSAALELVGSEWEGMLRSSLVLEFCERDSLNRVDVGGVCMMVNTTSIPKNENKLHEWIEKKVSRLFFEKLEAIEAALAIMGIALRNKAIMVPGMIDGLLRMLNIDHPSSHAGSWSLCLLVRKKGWTPKQQEKEKLLDVIANPSSDIEAVRWLITVFGETRDSQSIDAIISRLGDKRGRVRYAAINALGKIGDARAVELLIEKLDDENNYVRRAAVGALSNTCKDETDKSLLSTDLDGVASWLDPRKPVDTKRVELSAIKLKISKNEVRKRYENLAEKFSLKLEWRKNP